MLEAVRKGIPVIIIKIARGGFTYEGARRFANDIEHYMKEFNPGGLDFLHERIGKDLSELKQAILRALDANERKNLTFDSHKGDNAMVNPHVVCT